MLAVRKEGDEGQFLLSPPTNSRKKVPSPMVAAAAGTLVYQNAYGDTTASFGGKEWDEGRAGIDAAAASEEEVDYMPDGNIVIP